CCQPITSRLYLERVRYVLFSSSRRRHTRSKRDWSSDVCSSDLMEEEVEEMLEEYENEDFEPASFVSDKNEKVDVVQFVLQTEAKIGRASCRERVESEEGAARFKRKTSASRVQLERGRKDTLWSG